MDGAQTMQWSSRTRQNDRHMLAFAVTSLVMVAAMSVVEPARAGEPDPGVTPEQLADEGKALAREKKWQEALPKFRAAYERRRSYDVVGNLGITEHELGMWVAAAGHLDEALRGFPVTGLPVQRAALEERLADAESHVARLEITVEPVSACLSIAGQDRGCGPFNYPLYAEPGKVEIRVEAPGHEPLSRVERVAAGERSSLALTLQPLSVSVREPASGAEEALLPAWPSYVVGGVALATVAAGAGLGLAAKSASDDADELLDELIAQTGQQSPCASPSGATADSCAAIANDLARHDRLGNASTGLILTGVGLVAVSATLFTLSFVDGGESSSEDVESSAGEGVAGAGSPALRWEPMVGPGWLGVRGRW